jgi:hypothetical protein
MRTETNNGNDPFLALLLTAGTPASEAPVQIVPDHLKEAAKPEPCGKCNGRGILPEFNHVSGGVCFACEGTGIRTIKAVHGADLEEAF